MSEDGKQYRRMRDLNNAASKRCRVGRKRKSQVRFLFIKGQIKSEWIYEDIDLPNNHMPQIFFDQLLPIRGYWNQKI